MSVKKTGSPFSSGAESLDPLGGKEELRGGEKVSKNFEAALAEVAGQIEQTDRRGANRRRDENRFSENCRKRRSRHTRRRVDRRS